MMCLLYTHILSVKCLVVLPFQPDMAPVGLMEIAGRITYMTFIVMNWSPVSFYSDSSIWIRAYNKEGGMHVIMILFSQAGFMGSKVQWNTRVCNKQVGYKRPSFRRRSLLPSIFSTILCFIRNQYLNWSCDYYHLWFTYDGNKWISDKDNHYGSNRWAVCLTTMPRCQCGSIR